MSISFLTKLKGLSGVNYWPPAACAGFKISHLSKDTREVDVQLKMHWWNKNVFGTHFGGSLYAMIDPWYCLMLVANLGKDYVIWDKAATIRFLNPGVGTVTAKFRLTEDVIRRIKEEADREGRCQPTFKVEILDAAGKVVADADKVISVRRKDKIKARTAAAKHVAEKNLPHH